MINVKTFNNISKQLLLIRKQYLRDKRVYCFWLICED